MVVGDDRYIGTNVVLATGSYSRSLPGLTIEGRVITSEQALGLEWIPEKAIVLGGGVIGVEFASVWASFGTQVTIVEALPSLVPAEDPWAQKQLERRSASARSHSPPASGSPASPRTTPA